MNGVTEPGDEKRKAASFKKVYSTTTPGISENNIFRNTGIERTTSTSSSFKVSFPLSLSRSLAYPSLFRSDSLPVGSFVYSIVQIFLGTLSPGRFFVLYNAVIQTHSYSPRLPLTSRHHGRNLLLSPTLGMKGGVYKENE